MLRLCGLGKRKRRERRRRRSRRRLSETEISGRLRWGGRFAVRRNEWAADAGVLPGRGQNQLVTMEFSSYHPWEGHFSVRGGTKVNTVGSKVNKCDRSKVNPSNLLGDVGRRLLNTRRHFSI